VSAIRADDEVVLRRRRTLLLGLILFTCGAFVAVALVSKQPARPAPARVAPAPPATTTYCIESTVHGHTYRWSSQEQNTVLGHCP
jgi:hypothetical protein